MPIERFYLPEALESIAELTGPEHHHLAHVFRLSVGDPLELVNGQGSLAQAEILSLDKKKATLRILSLHTEPPPPPVILAQAIPRQSRLETIIEKGTELNASAFWLFPGERSEKETLSPNQLTRLESLMISALKQSGRLHLPTLTLLSPLSSWERPEGTLLFGDLRPTALPFPRHYHHPLILAIGPEKGLTPSEVTHLEALGGRGVRLGPNILRTDTAALAALSIATN